MEFIQFCLITFVLFVLFTIFGGLWLIESVLSLLS